MITVREHFNILGKKVKDKVTGFSGVATSLCFDLYGCIQVTVNPGLNKDNKLNDAVWFDITRLKIMDDKIVMDVPEFDYDSGDSHGPENKPFNSRF